MRTRSLGRGLARPAVRFAAIAGAAALVLTACGSSSEESTSEETAASETTVVEETTETTAAGGEIEVEHYFSGDLGEKAISDILAACEAETGLAASAPKIDHEAFKDAILVQLAGGNPPDLFSYWAGARTQSVLDGGFIAPIDDLWTSSGMDTTVPTAIADSAATYDGQKYLTPFVYHYVGLFYNPALMEQAGITEMPTTWDGLLADADKLKAAGITPFALGSTNRWPAQFWFDYLLLRTAGPEYRANLMAGNASYTDPEVQEALGLWKQLLDAGYFNASPNDGDWTDAADQVANGEAAMTLMGTWITGYWDGQGKVAGTDYNFFPFPEVTPGVPQAALGPVDGWLLTSGAKNPEGAKATLACLAGPEAQKAMALVQGALPVNTTTDTSEQNSVMQSASQEVQNSSAFVFNYDLATPPAVAEVGLDMFTEFIANPGDAEGILDRTQNKAAEAFASLQ